MTARPELAILILDDDAETRDLYRRDLERFYRVVTCAQEGEALAALAGAPFAALVLEPVALADGDWRFVAAVHALPGCSRLPIVLCSTLDARRRGAEVGAAAYLVKPVLPSTLRATLANVIQRAAGLAAPAL